jgi:hypothetical protein
MNIKYFLTLIFIMPLGDLFSQPNIEREIISTVINSELHAELKLHPRDTVFNKKGQIKRIRGFTFSSIYMDLNTETERHYQQDTLFNYCKMSLSELDRDLFEDFLTKNLSPIRLDSLKEIQFEIKPIPTGFTGDGHNPIVRVSRPGMNKLKNKAFIYYSRRWGPISGYGAYYLLIKSPKGWIIKESTMSWFS